VALTRWLLHGLVGVWILLAIPGVLFAQDRPLGLVAILERVGTNLEVYFQRAQRIVSTETVLVRSFDRAMQLNGFPRRLEYERRVEWDPSGVDGVPAVTVLRRLMSVNGRPPEPGDEDPCLAPESEGLDPLSVLLPARQSEFEFSLSGLERIDEHVVAHLEYVPVETDSGEVDWGTGECIRIELPGWYRGEVWVDGASGDVLRLDEHLIRRFEFREPQDRPRASIRWIVLERDDTTIRYERVNFEDPIESLMLPRSIEKSWATEGSGVVPRYFRSQRFSNYRRFVTEGRLVSPPALPTQPDER